MGWHMSVYISSGFFVYILILSLVFLVLSMFIFMMVNNYKYKMNALHIISRPVRMFLCEELERLHNGKVIYTWLDFSFEELTDYLPIRKRKSYKRALNEYYSALYSNKIKIQCEQEIYTPDFLSAISAIEKMLDILSSGSFK